MADKKQQESNPTYKEQPWDAGDGHIRWTRGIALPRFLIALVKPEWFTYVSGSSIKHVKVSPGSGSIEVVRTLHPGCEGIGLIEGFLKMQLFALAEIGRKNRILVYRADPNDDVLLADLKGEPDYDYISMEFTKNNLLVVLTGAPHFTIFVWKWTKGQQLVGVSTLERVQSTNMAISGINYRYWAEWSRNHLTFYELQEYTENNATIKEIPMPTNDCDLLYPDSKTGEPYLFQILSVAWTHSGELYALNDSNGLYKVHYSFVQKLEHIGQLDRLLVLNVSFYELVPYDKNCLGCFGTNGEFIIIQIRRGKLRLVKNIELSSKITKYLPIATMDIPITSFYAVTEIEKTVEYIVDGKLRNSFVFPDILLSQIMNVCFIERSAEFVAVINEKGIIYIIDGNTGLILTNWDFPFVASSIMCHPVHRFVAVGTVNGYIYYIDIKNLKQPKIIHQVYVMRAVIDKLEFTCRGRLLIAADTKEGYLFLQQALATTDFDFLDSTHVAGYIRHINVPSNHRDQRLQVLSDYHINDEVPFLLNNYHLESDYFDLVSSQLLDTPITSMCFSFYKRYLYAFTYTTRKIGLVKFFEDLQAGSLKEPETIFNSNHALEVNQLKLHGDNLFTFGCDGFVMTLKPPPKKQTPAPLEITKTIQTHFPGHGGIRYGIVSMNGCNIIAVGTDNTITHVQIHGKPARVQWGTTGYGVDFPRVIEQQSRYYADLRPDPSIGQIIEGDNDGHGIIYKLNLIEEREVIERYETDREEMLDEIDEINYELQELFDLNDTLDEDRLDIEEYEINEDAPEENEKEFEAKLLNMKIILSSLHELREEWVNLATARTFGQFEEPVCRFKGFKFHREVENYVQQHMKNKFVNDVIGVKHTRRLEKKLKRATSEIYLTAYQIHAKWSSMHSKFRNLASTNMPAELQKQIADMDPSVPSSPGPPAPTKLDYYDRLLERLAQIRRLNGEDEEDEVESDVESDDDDAEFDERKLSKMDENEESEEEEDEEEEDEDEDEDDELFAGGEKLDPELIKKMLAATGIPMSAQALAAQGKIPMEIAIQIRDEELEMHRLKRKPRKYNPRRKKSNQLKILYQSKAKKPKVAALELIDDEGKEKGDEDEDEEEEDEDEDKEEEEEEIDTTIRKKTRVVKEVDAATGKETVELVTDSSEESANELDQEDLEIQEERMLAESVLDGDEKERYTAIVRMLSGNLIWKQYPASLVFYSQAELYSIQQIRTQMLLIQAEIRKLQTLFNNAFQDCRRLKAVQIEGILTRNVRIREICDYFEVAVNIDEIKYDFEEDITQIFVVNDSEVPCEKYLDAEGRKQLELVRAAEEAKQKHDAKKKAAEEAKQNKGQPKASVVQPAEKTREDFLKEDIPKPDFMKEKEQWEWNYEEYIMADEYYKKVEEHEKMRQIFRTELQQELRILLRLNKQARTKFDNCMEALFRYKQIIEKNIRLEELKWLRLQKWIFEYYKLQREFSTKKQLLKKHQDRMIYSQNLASQIIARVEDCAKRFEEILERDRTLELSFREDMGPDVQKFHMEQFFKLYRKRPKLIGSKSQLLDLTIMMIKALQTPNLRWFSYENGELGQKAVNAIYEFDNPFFNPPNCPRTIWERFVHIRRQRLICEYEAKAIASDLIELQSVLEECDDRIEELSESVAVQLGSVANQRESILDIIHNVELQLIMKHGKVEIPSTQYYEDFQDMVLLDKKLIVDCNIKILKEGFVKMGILRKLKNAHKELKNLEWKFKNAKLSEKHLRLEEKDIQHTRVSKEILGYLTERSNFSLVQEQKLARIRHFHNMADTFHKRFLQTRGKVLGMFKRLVARKEYENEEKDAYLDQQNLKVNIQLNSCTRENPEVMMKFHEERIEMLMTLGAMMRTIAKNAAMICQLESELDRLYQKTYPML